MLRMGAKIYILLDILGRIVVSFLALFVIAGFCLNNDLVHNPIIIAGAIIAGFLFIGVFFVAVTDIIDFMKP